MSADPVGDVALAFRTHGARLHAALTRRLGADHLELVETALQDAFEEAVRRWPIDGVPDRPDGWLLAVARNGAIDRLRRDARFSERAHAVATYVEALAAGEGEEGVGAAGFGWELPDDLLTMMFVACHPALTVPARLGLTLRALCGLGVRDIAGALLSSEDAVKKQLVRARAKLRAERVAFALPDAAALDDRLSDVLRVVWLLFGEGHGAHTGELPIRPALCGEALRLGRLLAGHPRTDRPQVHALLALMALHASRLPARIGPDGHAVPLHLQDRGQWDPALIREGFEHLARSATGPPTSYHLEAGIAACHARARTADQTDWSAIRSYYDALVALDPSPVVRAQRAIAVAEVDGPGAALAELCALAEDPRLSRWATVHAAIAQVLDQLGEADGARAALERAVALAPTEAERRTLEARLRRPGG